MLLTSPSLPLVIGHRGNSGHAPENTLESFRQAVEIGVDGLELDVHLSADGEVVVIHDPTLDRTTSGSGRVEWLGVRELQAVDAGARFTRDGGATWPYRGTGVRIPTLDEVLTAFPTTPLIIEIKAPRAAEPVRALLERHAAAGRCLVASFKSEAIGPFRSAGFKTGATQTETARLMAPALAGHLDERPPFDAMCIPRSYRGLPLPVAAFARSLGRYGIPVHVWTVDDPAVAQKLWRDGVCGILTNEPLQMLGARGKG